MILGMSLQTYTIVHVIISLVAIGSGFVVLYGMLGSKPMSGWTAFFLLTTLLTSVTGFFFPFTTLLPSHITGIVSLIVLAPALYAIYGRHLAGSWRWVYVSGAVLALYLNVFVLVVQLFLKIPFVKALAPTQAEPPFAIAQGLVLVAFVVFGFLAVRKFHPERRMA